MKKIVYLMLLLVLFNSNVVKAATVEVVSNCSELELIGNEKYEKTCDLSYSAPSKTFVDKIVVSLTLKNLKLVGTVPTNSDWELSKISSGVLHYIPKSNPIDRTTNNYLGTLKFEYTGDDFSDPNGNCKADIFINSMEYTPSCDAVDGVFYDLDGNETTELNYTKVCLKPACQRYSDGTYSNKLGDIVSESEYKTSCGCRIDNNKYYDINGNETTELNYTKKCEKPKCEKYSDGTYSDKLGNLVTELEYSKSCEIHTCERLIDGTLYGKDGTEVTIEQYKEDCDVKYVCEKKDGKYYDDKGMEVTKIEFTKSCEEHKCEQLSDGTYYDDNRHIVSKSEFEKSCMIENPQTGSTVIKILLSITFISLLLVFAKKIVDKRNKFSKI